MRYLLLLVVVIGLAGCSAASDAFIATVQMMVEEGSISPIQGQEMISAFLEYSQQVSQQGLWNTVLVGLGSVVAAYTGINLFPGKKIKNPSA